MLLGHLLSGNLREMYRVEVKESAFCFSITKALFEYWCNSITDQGFLTSFLAIRREERGVLIVFFIDLPVITYPNYAHKHLDWKALATCAKKISLLLGLFNWLFPKENQCKDSGQFSSLFISEDSQLVCIETSHSTDATYHTSPVEVGYSEYICELLATRYTQNTDISVCEQAAFTLYQSLSTTRKRDSEKAKEDFKKYKGGFMGVTARVRQGGIPHFVVPGNCACLGANPDDFRGERGISSHNLGTSLQQMAMLAAVVSFWNEILKPLSKERV